MTWILGDLTWLLLFKSRDLKIWPFTNSDRLWKYGNMKDRIWNMKSGFNVDLNLFRIRTRTHSFKVIRCELTWIMNGPICGIRFEILRTITMTLSNEVSYKIKIYSLQLALSFEPHFQTNSYCPLLCLCFSFCFLDDLSRKK